MPPSRASHGVPCDSFSSVRDAAASLQQLLRDAMKGFTDVSILKDHPDPFCRGSPNLVVRRFTDLCRRTSLHRRHTARRRGMSRIMERFVTDADPNADEPIVSPRGRRHDTLHALTHGRSSRLSRSRTKERSTCYHCGFRRARRPSPTKLRENSVTAIVMTGRAATREDCEFWRARREVPTTRAGLYAEPEKRRNASRNMTDGSSAWRRR